MDQNQTEKRILTREDAEISALGLTSSLTTMIVSRRFADLMNVILTGAVTITKGFR
jgi:hypothetical protein